MSFQDRHNGKTATPFLNCIMLKKTMDKVPSLSLSTSSLYVSPDNELRCVSGYSVKTFHYSEQFKINVYI
jgi:hypothetical protein